MQNESFGFGPYIGSCNPTDTYIVAGACSDQNTPAENERIKKGYGISRKKKNIKRTIPSESFVNFCKKRELFEQEDQQYSQEITDQEAEKDPKTDLWRAKKKDILSFWRNLPGVRDDKNFPITPKPIEYEYKGSTYNKDGLRITGSSNFINSVLPKLKDFLSYENPNSKLALIYRETTPLADQKTGNRSFAFYIKVKERGPQAKGKLDI